MKQGLLNESIVVLGAVLSIGVAAMAQSVPLEEPKNHGGFHAFAFSPDPSVIAGGTGVVSLLVNGKKENTQGGEVILWDTKSGKIRRTLGSHKATVELIAYSVDGTVLISASPVNGMIKVWDGKSGVLRQTLQLPGQIGKSSNGSELLCSVSNDGKSVGAVSIQTSEPAGKGKRIGDTLMVWDAASGRARWQLANSEVYALAFSADGSTLVASCIAYEAKDALTDAPKVAAAKRTVAWDSSVGKELWNSEMKGWRPEKLCFVPDKGLFAFDNRRILIVNPATGARVKEIKLQGKESLRSPWLSPDGKRFAVSQFMGGAIEWGDTDSGKITAVQEFTADRVTNVAFSPDLQTAVCNMRFVPQILKLSPRPTDAVDAKGR
jgi:WD40 repeat protein